MNVVGWSQYVMMLLFVTADIKFSWSKKKKTILGDFNGNKVC